MPRPEGYNELAEVELREDLLVISLSIEPETNSSPKQLRKGARAALKEEGLDDSHELVSLAFWRLLNRDVIQLSRDLRKLQVNYDSDDVVWQRIAAEK